MDEIEQKFFRTFEIRSRADYGFSAEGKRIESLELYPPEITDKILLELFILWNKCEGDKIYEQWENKEEFKNWLLYECCYSFLKEHYLKQVQALFKEVE